MTTFTFPGAESLVAFLRSGAVPGEWWQYDWEAQWEPALTLRTTKSIFPSKLAEFTKFGLQVARTNTGPWVKLHELAQIVPLQQGAQGERQRQFLRLPTAALPEIIPHYRRAFGQRPSIHWLDEECDWAGIILDQNSFYFRTQLANLSGHELFTEQLPGVWVAAGFFHPALDLITNRAASWLIRSTGDWQPFPELHSTKQEVPIDTAVTHTESIDVERLTITWRLAPSAAERAPRASLWVFRERALIQLSDLCRQLADHLINQLQLATGTVAGEPVLILRRVGKTGEMPPLGAAEAYRWHSQGVPIYIPLGRDLQPQARPDFWRTQLNIDPTQCQWLRDDSDTGLTSERIPESAFVPLNHWLQYVHPEPTIWQPWEERDWQTDPPFTDEAPEKAHPGTANEIGLPRERPTLPSDNKASFLSRAFSWMKRSAKETTNRVDDERPLEKPIPQNLAEKAIAAPRSRLPALVAAPEQKQRESIQQLEKAFLTAIEQSPGPYTKYWVNLAQAYSQNNNHHDAAICWLNALWDLPRANADWAWNWLVSEGKAHRDDVQQLNPNDWLGQKPTVGTTRALAAWVVWASVQQPAPEIFVNRPVEINNFLNNNEGLLPLRAIWLARLALAQASGSDVLGLTRTRDRLINRLRNEGLNFDRDIPSIIRFYGETARARYQEAHEWLLDKRQAIHHWIQRLSNETPISRLAAPDRIDLKQFGLEANTSETLAYADLLIAWGLARLGKVTKAQQLVQQAHESLPPQAVHQILLELFRFRIGNAEKVALDRQSTPRAIWERIQESPITARYAIDKLREHLRMVEPILQVDAYRSSLATTVDRTLLQIENQSPESLSAQALTWFKGPGNLNQFTADRLTAIIDKAHDLAPEALGATLDLLPLTLDSLASNPRALARLMEKAFQAARTLDRPELARDLTNRLMKLTNAKTGWDLAEKLSGQAFRTLRQLGLKTEADRLLHHVSDGILRGYPITWLRANQADDFQVMLRTMLHVASGWYFTGETERADAIIEEARTDLFAPATRRQDRIDLAIAYAHALGASGSSIVLGRLEEIYQRLDGIAVVGTSNGYFCLSPLRLIEATVRTVVSDDFDIKPRSRDWRHRDEQNVWRRIIQETKQAIDSQGL